MDDQLLREFLAEADERIEVLFADIERLRRVGHADGRTRRELLARIFRHVHTLKGSAASIPQLAPVGRLAHEFENLLDAIRGGRAPLTDAAIDTGEDATHALALALAAVSRGEDAAAELPSDIFQQLRQHAAGASQLFADGEAPPRANPTADLPEEIAHALSNVERRHLNESVREGARALLVAAAFELITLDEQFGRFTAALAACGEIISTFPGGADGVSPDEISFRLLYTTSCTSEELEERLAPFGARIAWANAEPEIIDARTNADAAPHVSSSGANEAPAHVTPDAAGVLPGTPPRAPIFVRVPLQELDELVTATHELFTDTLALLEQLPVPETAAAEATGADAATRAGDATSAGKAAHEGEAAHVGEAAHEGRARRLRENFSALEERTMSLRMQPLRPVLERAARAARIAARAAGKEIEMEVAGGDVRVDRALAEQIGEPLLHLLRNAVDHGIEAASERRAAGKPARGRVRLEVAAEGSRVRVRVADDGRGVDTERVARVAVAGGLLEAGARITDEQALRLIFRPGFSTAAEVSDVSGRGVGLDVVEHALERAGGELRVRTRRGEGTTFELRVPLTLALVNVVVARARGHAYAFDASHVVATAQLDAADIRRDEGDAQRGSALWEGEQLPFISLRSLLGDARAQAGDAGVRAPVSPGGDECAVSPVSPVCPVCPVCVVRRGREGEGAWPEAGAPERFVVAVDAIDGEREALVRSLGRHATRWRGVSGAFALRDGTVALLLDLPRLFEK